MDKCRELALLFRDFNNICQLVLQDSIIDLSRYDAGLELNITILRFVLFACFVLADIFFFPAAVQKNKIIPAHSH